MRKKLHNQRFESTNQRLQMSCRNKPAAFTVIPDTPLIKYERMKWFAISFTAFSFSFMTFDNIKSNLTLTSYSLLLNAVNAYFYCFHLPFAYQLLRKNALRASGGDVTRIWQFFIVYNKAFFFLGIYNFYKVLFFWRRSDKHPAQSLISVKLFVFPYKPEKLVKL